MNKKYFLILNLLLISILYSCNTNKNDSQSNKTKVITKYALQGNDTIAKYIRVESDTTLNYVIFKSKVLKDIRYWGAHEKILDTIIHHLGVDSYLRVEYEKVPSNQDSCYLFLDDNIYNDYTAYDCSYYYLLGKYDDWHNKLKYAERPLKKAKEQQLTSKNRIVNIHASAGYWGPDHCYISSDEILTMEEMEELMTKNHLENYHKVHFEITSIGLDQEYAENKNGSISFIPKYPKNKEEANIRGIKETFDFWKEDVSLLLCNDLNTIRESIKKLNNAYRRGEGFYNEAKDKHPYVEKEFEAFKKYMIKHQKQHFIYFRSGYASFLSEQGWDYNIEATTVGDDNRGLVLTSHLFSRSKNIDDVYNGLKDVLTELRFSWVEFRVSKYGKSRREWIVSAKDDVFE